MKQIFLATGNKGKIKELEALLSPLGYSIRTMHDVEAIPEVIEDGYTFEENAIKKATAFYQEYGIPALADDSGLEVDILDGRPGIYSARYAGEGKGDQANNEKLLQELQGVPNEQRTAQFTCVIALVDGSPNPITAYGSCKGIIAEAPSGSEGFGYDPIFYLPNLQKTMAQLPKEEKNKISHRAQALQKLVEQLKG